MNHQLFAAAMMILAGAGAQAQVVQFPILTFPAGWPSAEVAPRRRLRSRCGRGE